MEEKRRTHWRVAERKTLGRGAPGIWLCSTEAGVRVGKGTFLCDRPA
jgi:hypothetical protein